MSHWRAALILGLAGCTPPAPVATPLAPTTFAAPPQVATAVPDPCASAADRLKRVPELVSARRLGRLTRLIDDVEGRCPSATSGVRAELAKALLVLGDIERATWVASEPAAAGERQTLLALIAGQPKRVDSATAARELRDAEEQFKKKDVKGAFSSALAAAGRAPKPGAALMLALQLAPAAGQSNLVPELRERALFALERATKASATTAVPTSGAFLLDVGIDGTFTFGAEPPNSSGLQEFSVRSREGRELFSFPGPGLDHRASLAYDNEGQLRILDSADGSTVRVIGDGLGPLQRLASSRSGERALVSEGPGWIGQGSYHVWDTQSAKLLVEESCGQACNGVTLSPSGSYVVRFDHTDPPALKIRHIDRKSEVAVKLPASGEMHDGFGVRDDDSVWVRRGPDFTIFDPKTGKKLSRTKVPAQGEVLLAESGGAVWLASYPVKNDAVVRIEGTKTTVITDTERVCSFKVPEPYRAFCAIRSGVTGAPYVLTADGGLEKLVASATAAAADVAFSADERTLLAASSLADPRDTYGIAQWRVPSAHLGTPATGHRDTVTSVIASPGALVFSGSEDGTIRAWQGTTEEWSTQMSARVMGLASDRKGELVAAGFYAVEDNFAVVLNAKDGRVVSKLLFSGRGMPFTSPLAFNASSTLLVSGHDDGALRSWNPKTGGLRSKQQLLVGAITALEPSPVSDVLAVGGSDGLLIVDTVGSAAPIVVSGCVDTAEDLAFTPDGRTLFAACGTNVIEADAATGNVVRAWPMAAAAHRIALAPQAGLIAVATEAGVVLLKRGSAAPLASLFMHPSLRSGVVRTESGHVQLDGSAIKDGLSCKIGLVGHPFELCEERFVVPNLLERLLAGDRSFESP